MSNPDMQAKFESFWDEHGHLCEFTYGMVPDLTAEALASLNGTTKQMTRMAFTAGHTQGQLHTLAQIEAGREAHCSACEKPATTAAPPGCREPAPRD